MASPEKLPIGFLQQNTLGIDLITLPTEQKLEIYKNTLTAMYELPDHVTSVYGEIGIRTLTMLQKDLNIIIVDLDKQRREKKLAILKPVIDNMRNARIALDLAKGILNQDDKKSQESIQKFGEDILKYQDSLDKALEGFDEVIKALKAK